MIIKPLWHLRSIIAATAALTSFGAALLLPTLLHRAPPIPEMFLPFHATAPAPDATDGCSNSSEVPSTVISGIKPGEIVWVDLYAPDYMGTTPPVQIEGHWIQNCAKGVGEILTAKAQAITVSTSIECIQAQNIALKIH